MAVTWGKVAVQVTNRRLTRSGGLPEAAPGSDLQGGDHMTSNGGGGGGGTGGGGK